jgi:predicted DCC family thiol-disulfide oxidoreductase YuxK
MELKLPLLIYDDQCPLCVRFKQGLERLDLNHILTYVPLSSESVFKQFPQLDPEICRTKVHFLRTDGGVVTGQEVVVEVVKIIPGVGKLAWLLETDVGKSASSYFLDHVENLRKKLQEKDKSCGTCN